MDPLPVEQFREVVLGAACRRGRVDAHRGLDAAEELQPKLLLLLNRQMFVLVLSSLNRQTFVLGFGPSLLPHLYFFSCGQSSSTVSEHGSLQVPFQQAMV